MTKPFFERLAKIEDVLERGPAHCCFPDEVRPLLCEEASIKYFYQNVKDLDWLDVLKESDVFSDAPRPIQGPDEGKAETFARWWPGRSLVRFAEQAPEKVRDILLAGSPTDNPWVYSTVVDAANLMPSAIAASLVPMLVEWVGRSVRIWPPEDYVDLVVHLAEGGEPEGAIALARALLSLSLQEARPEQGDWEGMSLRPEPHAVVDSYVYKMLVEKVVPVLSRHAGIQALDLFLELLKGAAMMMAHQGGNDSHNRGGWAWPPAIEDHEQNRVHDMPKDMLVFAVRDASEGLIGEHGPKVLERVESYDYKIFKRVGLHLRRIWPDVDLPGTNRILSDTSIYRDSVLHHELWHLMRVVFGLLAPETQETFFAYVEKAEVGESFQENFSRWHDRPPTADEIERARRRWQFDELVPIKEHLTGEWRARLEELSRDFEVSEHPDFLAYIGEVTGVAPTTPRSHDELASMPVPELAQYLNEYQAPDDPFEMSLEGLGGAVAKLVKENPARFVPEARRFEGLSPLYVRRFISGFNELLTDKAEVEPDLWTHVLGLCSWVVEQKRDEKLTQGRYAHLDPGWGWTRSEIASTIENGLKSQTCPIPSSLRAEVWAVLMPLTDDPDPSAENESERTNPADLSINSVRGRAIQATVQYALWVHRSIKEKTEMGFDEMPEVREVLEEHLLDPSLAIRAVYGQWFPWLVLLDEQWARRNKRRIFPRDADLRRFYEAAWETYILFCNPYNNVLPVLKDEYLFAATQIGTWSEEHHRLADPDECLMNHLLTYYWYGAIDLNSPLLFQAYERASAELRGHALGFIGRTLQASSDDEVDSETRSRMRALWEWRLNVVCDSEDSSKHGKEIEQFGTWLTCGKFEDEWALGQLEEVLRITKWAELHHLVVKRLAEISEQFPGRALVCLEMMVQGDKEGWNISLWEEDIRTILSKCIATQEAEVKDGAIALVNRLGSLGHLEFRDLVSSHM